MFFRERKTDKISCKIIYLIINKIKPIIIVNCLKKENYLITDKQAEDIALILIKQAYKLKVLNIIINKLGIK